MKQDVVTPAAVTETPDSVSITNCGDNTKVTFTACANAVSGNATVRIISANAGDSSYYILASIPITVTQTKPTNAGPSETITGVANNDNYETSAVKTAGCSEIDAEDD